MRCAKYLPPLGPFDVIFLSTLGVGAVAWIARSTLFGKSNRSSSSPKPPENAPSTKQSSLSERNFVKVMQEQGRRVIFFYGSQTGTAEDYASRLAKECSQRYGVSCMAADLEQYDLSYLDTVPEDNLVVFVMATYGEGEPTDNAVETWELITGEVPDFSQGARLEGLRYMIFGLGNKTYEHYNAVCRTMDARLQELGATRIGERGEGDDDASLEEDFLSWQESMWPAFCSALGVDESSAQSGPRQPVFAVKELTTYDEAKVYFGELAEWLKENEEIVYDAKRPYFAPAETRDLFRDTDRHCLHVEIDISRTNLTYQTGDHVAIWPTNSEAQVERLASILGLIDKLDTVVTVDAIDSAASKKHPFPVPTTYRAIFRHYLDICAPASRQTLMSLVEYAPTEASKAKLQTLASNKDEYHEKVSDAVRNLAEVLEMCQDEPRTGFFNSVPFDLVVESVPRLQPRYYSISSSSYIHPHTVVATAVTLKYNPTPDRTVYGVATNYLWKIHAAAHGLPDEPGQPDYDLLGPRGALEGRKIPVHIRRSQFKLPRNPSSPVIMIGPGTGVAPFRGFVHERAAMKRDGKPVGPTVLFYGCRHPDQDFLYADEWDALFQTLGEGSRIITAFSRYTEQKVYVQHKLQEHGEAMWALIEKGAYIYVCGDAKNMARDVQRTFVNLAQSVGGKTEKQAQDFIKRLRNTGRYLEDVWL